MGRADPNDSTDRLIAAMQVLNRPHEEEKGLIRYVGTAIGAVGIALCLWVGTTLVSLDTSISTMNANILNIGHTVDELKASQGDMTKEVSDLKSRVSQHDLRLSALEQGTQRMNDRVRIVEGQKPLPPRMPQ